MIHVASPFAHTVLVIAMRGTGQDRAAVLETDDGLVVALADGAGGTGNGAVAAQAVIDAIATTASAPPAWTALLSQLDHDPRRLGLGQTTAILLSVTRHGLRGASVGDSAAWLLRGSHLDDLTAGQARKPLLGAGCHPVAIHAGPLAGATLLVASDGLFRYAKPADVLHVASGPDLAAASAALVDLVRLPTGSLQDDVAIVLVRETSNRPPDVRRGSRSPRSR